MHASPSVRYTAANDQLLRSRDEKANRAASWTMADIALDGCARWPQRLALADANVELTFAELQQRALRLAERLAALQVGPGDRVALAGHRDVDTVVAILGISMLGACYVPLDPAQPAERLRFLLADADVRGLIAASELRGLLSEPGVARFFMELEGVSRPGRDGAGQLLFPRRVKADSAAYIMYTSGSTGLPKGVQIEHRSVRAFFETHNERVRIEPGDRCLNSGPFHFDVSLMDVFLPLYAGASVFFGSELPLASLVLSSLERFRITHFYAVGTVLALITGDGRKLDRYDLSSLRMLQTGAEVCNVRVVNEWLSRLPSLRFLNSYGPTEATVGCVSYLKPSPGPIRESHCPIGQPHRGTELLLLASDGSVVHREGAVGELAIAGPQLMRGYWRRQAEDERAFLWINGVRYYRSGDQAYRDERGDYHFVGRRDDEIKLNGHRIHLNEVLHCVQRDARVEAAVAGVIVTGAGSRELVVIAVTSEAPSPELARELERQTAAILPNAMQPARWGLLRSFPRLSSGKVDRETCLEWLAQAVKRADSRHYRQFEQSFQPL